MLKMVPCTHNIAVSTTYSQRGSEQLCSDGDYLDRRLSACHAVVNEQCHVSDQVCINALPPAKV